MEKSSVNNNQKVAKPANHRATSYDVARLAGVSQSAVSRCCKPGASVSAKTRAKVMKASDELGYQPNAIARGLITRRSNIVAVITTEFTNLNYPEMMSHLNAQLSEHGVHILLFTVGAASDMRVVLDQIWQYQVDGIIAASQFSDGQIEQCRKRGIPLVFYNRVFSDSTISSVGCDHFEGAKLLVEHLLKRGHKRFAVFSGPNDSAVAQERLQGAMSQLKQAGAHYDVYQGDYTYDSAAASTIEMMSSDRELPQAVICANDIMAIGCIDTLRAKYGLRIPEDLSVVGFDGIAASKWQAYDLTTIVQPLERMVEATVSMLMERIEDSSVPAEKRQFGGKLKVGLSA